MADPVLLLADSHTYERSALAAWLRDHGTSPVTGQLLASKEVVPNHTLRSLIHRLAEVHLAATRDALAEQLNSGSISV